MCWSQVSVYTGLALMKTATCKMTSVAAGTVSWQVPGHELMNFPVSARGVLSMLIKLPEKLELLVIANA